MSVSLILGSAVLVVWLCFLVRRYGRFLYLTSKVPGPSLWDFVFHHAKGLQGDYSVQQAHKISMAHNYKPWGVWGLREFFVCVSDCESMKKLYESKILLGRPNVLYKEMAYYMGKGLFTVDGEEHKLHKKILGPVYHRKVGHTHLPQMNILANQLTDKLRQLANGEVDTRSMMREHIGLMSIYFYSEGHLSVPRVMKTLDYAEEAMYEIRLEGLNPAHFYLWHRLKRSTREKEKKIREVLADRKPIFDEMMARFPERMSKFDDKKPTCPMDVIILHNMMKGEEVIDHEGAATTLLSASQSAAAFMLNACLVMIALHPEVQERIFEEIEAMFGGSMRPMERGDLAQLKYLEMTIKETLRIFPAGPIISRKAAEEMVLGGVTVPKGATVLINIFSLQRNPELYEDPLKFDPTRFSAESSKGRHPYAFVPFSAGPKSCIGIELAWIMLKVSLCYVFREFQVLPGTDTNSIDDFKPMMNITFCSPKSPLRFVKRNTDNQGSNLKNRR